MSPAGCAFKTMHGAAGRCDTQGLSRHRDRHGLHLLARHTGRESKGILSEKNHILDQSVSKTKPVAMPGAVVPAIFRPGKAFPKSRDCSKFCCELTIAIEDQPCMPSLNEYHQRPSMAKPQLTRQASLTLPINQTRGRFEPMSATKNSNVRSDKKFQFGC